MLDPVKAERAEKSLDEFINSRSEARRTANVEESLRRISEDAHASRQRKANRIQWLNYHLDNAERLRRSMTDLVARHEEAAARLQEQLLQEGNEV